MFTCNPNCLKNTEANREQMHEQYMDKCPKCSDRKEELSASDVNNCIENNNFCGCVGYGYVPWQKIKEVYCAENAISRGTVFPELDLPIDEYGKVCKRKGNV